MESMCLSTDDSFAGYAIGVADCDGDVTIEYFNTSGVSQGGTLPANWAPCTRGPAGPAWTPTHVTLTYASPTNIDFTAGQFMTLNISANLTLTATNYGAGRDIWLKISETGGSSRTLAYPSGWVTVGTALPSSLAANKTLLIHLISYGAAEANTVAHFWVQA